MRETPDFERAWLSKLSTCLGEVGGAGLRDRVMAGSEGLTSKSEPRELITWTQQAIERLVTLVGEADAQQVMLGCACQYPKSHLADVRQAYAASGDLGVAHQMLQERFEAFLRSSLNLDEPMVEDVVRRGWGLAGLRQGRMIVATKIPKSQFLADYLSEPDPDKKRQYYCHCPRIRAVLQSSETMPATYCYCGAGYYKGIWEEIVQRPVEVELLESVLAGDEVCKVAVRFP